MNMRTIIFPLITIIAAALFSCGGDNQQDSSGIDADSNQSGTTGQSERNFRYVTAEDGLRLRTDPDLNARVIVIIPFGEEVNILEEMGGTQTISGSTGKWTLITWNVEKGWAFGGFLGAGKKEEPSIDPKLLYGSWFEAFNKWPDSWAEILFDIASNSNKDSIYFYAATIYGFSPDTNRMSVGTENSGFHGSGEYSLSDNTITARIFFSDEMGQSEYKYSGIIDSINRVHMRLRDSLVTISSHSEHYLYRVQTPFHDAIKKDSLATVRNLFAEYGNDPNCPLFGKLTPLHIAAASNSIRCAEFLLSKNAQINAINVFGETPLYYAVMSGKIELVAFLLNHGAQRDKRSDNGLTAPELARKLLLEMGGEEYQKIVDLFESKG